MSDILWFLELLFLFIALLSSCSRAPIKGPENSMSQVKAPVISDDLPLAALVDAVKSDINHLKKIDNKSSYNFGNRVIPKEQFLAGLQLFVDLYQKNPNATDFYKAVSENFDFQAVYGNTMPGEIFLTSYYEPIIKGSRKKTPKFSRALYGPPKNLVDIDLSLFDSKFNSERRLRGRLDGRKLIPYYSREDIDSKSILRGKGLEICWVDPVDAFLMQIQGSGTVEFSKKNKTYLNYADKNGLAYDAIGKYLKTVITDEKLNLHSIEAYLRKLPPSSMQALLNKNPSYVFFKSFNKSATTSLGVPATNGRTIATDSRYFPKGALAFLLFDKPKFENNETLETSGSERVGRFVLDQDVGGAITGPGRADLFWGRGADAKRYSGVIKSNAMLYYLTPKVKQDINL